MGLEKEHPDLHKKAVTSGFWILALRILTQVASFSRYIVLARLLAVKDFGLLGVAMLLIGILETFTRTGFQAALIQHRNDIRPYLNTVWTFDILRGLVLYVILYFGAPLAASLKIAPAQMDLAIKVIRVTGLSLVIQSFVNVGMIYFQKELQFHKRFFMQVATTLFSILVTIVLAISYRSVWALVAGRLVSSMSVCVLSYWMHPYRPRLNFEITKATQLWRFGKWVTGGSILGFLLNHGDDLFVWGYLGTSALGYYQMAYRLSNLPATEITNVISQVTFPAYAKVQNDKKRLRDAYFKVLEYTTFLSFPIAGLILVFAPDFVHLFMGDKWKPAIVPMQILAFYGLLKSFGATRAALFQAVGRPNLSVYVQSLRLLLILVLLYPMTKIIGIVGTSLVVLVCNLICQPLAIMQAARVLDVSIFRLLRVVQRSALSTLAFVCLCLIIRLFADHRSYILLGMMILLSVMVYALLNLNTIRCILRETAR